MASLEYEHTTVSAWATADNTTTIQRLDEKEKNRWERQDTRNIDCGLFSISQSVWVKLSEERNLHKQYENNGSLTF